MKKIFLTIFIFNSILIASKPTLLFYCGITMVKPMKEMIAAVEKKEHCKIKIIQGATKDLYDSLSYSKKGDLYLPGSESYIDKKTGYFGRSVYIGFNQAAIFVRKKNPKHINSLDNLLDKKISTVLCDYKSGSIGKATKKILIKYKGEEFFEDVFDATVSVGTDSRNLNRELIDKNMDMTINWKATAFWKENVPFVDIVEIDKKYAPKKKLMLTELTFSKHKDIVNKFLDFAISKDGQKIMKKYGFR